MSELIPAFVLHSRLYRNTSKIIEFFTAEHGRIAAVVRGVRSGRQAWRGCLQAFTPILVSFSGRYELKTLTKAEATMAPYLLQGNNLISGLYLNELLLRILPPADPHPQLYKHYQYAIAQINQGNSTEMVLRSFEWQTLNELGYGLQFENIIAAEDYIFNQEIGFSIASYKTQQRVYTGDVLLEIAKQSWQERKVLVAAKYLFRNALLPLLGNKPLRSRELWLK